MAPLSLSQLLDAAIAAPDFQSVNFRALHSLLQAVLGHLGLQDRSPRGLEQPAERDRARTPAAGQQPQQAGEQLPAKDPLQDTAGGSEADVAAGVGQPVQRVEGDESSGSEDTAGYRALLEEISQMKEAQSRMQGEIRMIQEALGLGNRQDAAGRLPGLCDLRTLGSDVQMLKERLGLYPDPEEVSNMVHWDVLEDCLVGSKGERGRDGGRPRREEEEPSATTKSPASDADTPQGASSVLGPRESPAGLKDPGAALTAPEQQAGVPSDRRRDAGTRAMMQTASRDVQTTSLGTQPTRPESTGTQTTSRLGTQAESTVTQTPISGERLSTQLAGAGPLAAGTLLPTAQGFEIPVDADARATAHVQELALPSGSGSAYHNAYKCYAETVEAVKQIGQLRHLYAALKEQVAQLEASRLERTELEKLRLLLQEGGQESVANTLGDLQAQVSSLQGLARELQGVAREVQGEKGKIRKLESAVGKLEAASASWQTDASDQPSLLLGSPPQEGKRDVKHLAEQQQISKAALDQVVSQRAEGEQEQLEEVRVMESTGQEAAACPMCSSDTSTRLGMVLRRYEKLQGLVESLMSRKKTGKAVRQLPGKSQQDEEVLKRIQAAILQMQGECEKLNSVTGSLLDDSRQQQKDIEGLLQSVERLEKEKADKEDLEMGMDEKADKGALESKVSRAQFEASLELLKERNQEVLSRVTGQEQGLHEVQQQLREEMAPKLDRLELGPFQQELDEHWKSSLEQLKETAPPMEADDAAGIRKQLLVDFQCLSCDRQLGLRVPGSPIPPIPPFPPLVPHVTGRSQPVLKTEQTHREPMAACRYPTVPRQCGGQHTLTRPLQRSLRLPLIQPSAPEALQPSTLLPSKQDKIELLGQDSRRAGPCPSAPGTTGPLEQRSGSSHSLLVQGHRPHPPLQPRRTDAATRQPGWTGGHQLNPIAPAPQQARGSSSQQQQ
ncbi:glutamine-rich protein 2-like isoform X1 [Lathamus discolor]|uniref:glutamine-rich protein 2-like isoform X1 n=1 Tax=Lathamus discolor TaxID=678569 RepID=UPI0032B7E447